MVLLLLRTSLVAKGGTRRLRRGNPDRNDRILYLEAKGGLVHQKEEVPSIQNLLLKADKI